jgi:hypothetical protein
MDRITSAILLLIAALVVHLVEEVKTGFRKKLPIGEMPRLLFIGINVVVYAFCFTTLLLSAHGNELAIPFAWVFAIAMLMNGIGHIGMMLVRREYFPGGLTAFLLLPISAYLIIHLLNR